MVMDFVVTSQMAFLRCVKQNASILDNVQTPNVTGWYVWYLSNCQVMLVRVQPNCIVFYLKRQVRSEGEVSLAHHRIYSVSN